MLKKETTIKVVKKLLDENISQRCKLSSGDKTKYNNIRLKNICKKRSKLF